MVTETTGTGNSWYNSLFRGLRGGASRGVRGVSNLANGSYKYARGAYNLSSLRWDVDVLCNNAAIGTDFQFYVPPEKVRDARSASKLILQTIEANKRKFIGENGQVDYNQALMLLNAVYNTGVDRAYDLYSVFRMELDGYTPGNPGEGSLDNLLTQIESRFNVHAPSNGATAPVRREYPPFYR